MCIFVQTLAMKLNLLILLLLLSFTMYAQDYLVTTKGDTVKGAISFQLNGKIEQALIKGTKRETIASVATRVVVAKGKRYKPVQFNSQVLFMEILTEGYLSLLAFQPPNIMAYDGRLLQKRDGKILEVPTIGFKKQISNYLSDFPDISTQIQNGELNRTDLDEIITQYNNFITGKTETQKEQTQTALNQLSKSEMLKTLQADIEKSDLALKQDALDILLDWGQKIQEGKPIPTYLQKALKTSVDMRSEFILRIDELAKN